MQKKLNDDHIEKIDRQLGRDINRLADLLDEVSEIVKRVHLLGMEQGSIQTYLAMTEKETEE